MNYCGHLRNPDHRDTASSSSAGAAKLKQETTRPHTRRKDAAGKQRKDSETMPNNNIPFFVNRSLELTLSENGYLRSDANKQAFYAEIKKLLPNMSDEDMNREAIDEVTNFVDNSFAKAWSKAYDICKANGQFTTGYDKLPGDCFDDVFFSDPESPWPPSQPTTQRPPRKPANS